MPEKQAFATTLAVMTPIACTSALLYLLRNEEPVVFAWRYFVGGALGGALAGVLLQKCPVVWLRRIMGVFLLYGGVKAVLLL